MTLDFSVRTKDAVAEVKVTGDLTLGPDLQRFADSFADQVKGGNLNALLLDLSGLSNIDSAGLGELVMLYTTAASHNCRMALANVPPGVVGLLQTTMLDGLLPRYDSMESARRG